LEHLHSGLRYKRLEKGRFRWPEAEDSRLKVVLSHEELALLVGGIHLAQARRRRWYRNSSFSEVKIA
jgi:transposase